MSDKCCALIESLAARNEELFEQVAALTEERDWYSTANERAKRAEAALAECRAKLEVDPRTKYDGIDCRDETIRLLEKELEESARLHGMGASREAALQARLAESERKGERLKALLHSLHALVWGECPSLLNEDSGGSGHLDADIRAEFKEDKP